MVASALGFTVLTDLHIDNDTYRKITEMSFSQNTSIEKLINHMLQDQLRTLAFRRSEFILEDKRSIQNITEQLSENVLINAAKNAEAHLEVLGMLIASEQTKAAKPTLTDRLNAFRFIMSINGFPMEIAPDPSDQKIRTIARMEMGRKFSLYVGEAIKIGLGGFAEVDKTEVSETSLYIELTKK